MSAKDDREILTLRIKRFTPRTLPMRRLLTYLAKLSELLGDDKHVHLLRVVSGSAAPKIAVDAVARNRVLARCKAARRHDGPPELVRLRDDLNELLANDNTSADLLDVRGDNILVFPGRQDREEEQVAITEPGVLRGRVMRIGGTDKTVPMLLELEPGRYQRCNTTREMARDIIKHYEKDIEVTGKGKWRRGRDGLWSLEDFLVAGFEPLQDRPGIVETLDRMSLVEGSGWNELDDPISTLLLDRHGPAAKAPEGAAS